MSANRAREQLVDFVLTALRDPPLRVLEVGCGAGELARALDAAGHDILAVDPDAPQGSIFRRTTLEELDDVGPFDAAVATYSLHHIEDLEHALDRIAGLLEPDGVLVLEEFGWDRVDRATAIWYAEQQEKPVETVQAEWREEHLGLHGYAVMRHALEARFAEQSFEWRPYLYRCLERDELESDEQDAIARGVIQAVGFRYCGLSRE